MPRPFKCRRVCGHPRIDYFKPGGVPVGDLEEVKFRVDEFEALRLADWEGLYQEEAAIKMGVSRQTFGNIINSAHRKLADAIVNMKALKIEGGIVQFSARGLICPNCKHRRVIASASNKHECSKCLRKKAVRARLNRNSGKSADLSSDRKKS